MQRYAIYYVPDAGPFADFTAAWLGWDLKRGVAPPRPAVEGLPGDAATLTSAARKYGFHGTIKAPFRLLRGGTEGALMAGCAALAHNLAPVRMDRLSMQSLGGFLALLAEGDMNPLHRMASDVVMALETFRAPLTPTETAKRRPESLSTRQRELLARYGYPYVLEEFQFHLTLTGALSDADLATTRAALTPHLEPLLPEPFVIRDLCLCAEGEDGMFRLLHRYALTG